MALTKAFHWQQEDYFPYLLKNNVKTAVVALEYLVDDIHEGKEATVDMLLKHKQSDTLLYGLIKLMSSDNLRVSGNSAYVFGTVAESEEGIERIMELLQDENNKKEQPESENFLLYLVNLLRSTDYECLMNAAGTIGTISESNSGRDWLILQPLLDDVIELCTMLLDNINIWVSSNAALVIARISIEEAGCARILAHHMAHKIFTKLITSLGSDNAGRGMNCAFAIGRICDDEARREELLKVVNSKTLVESLSRMIEVNSDNGCTKNACFALSSLAATKSTANVVIEHNDFDSLLNSLCDLLLTNSDAETQWFSAMLMRVFSSYPVGCIKMKNIEQIWSTLSELNKSKKVFSEVKEEIGTILDSLKPLEKSEPIKATVKSSTEIFCEWTELKNKSNFNVNYMLYKDNQCVYNGPACSFLVKHLKPYTEYSFKVQSVLTDNNENSECSETVDVITDESLPTEPLNLRTAGSTTALIKVQWDPPAKMNGVCKGYHVFKDDVFMDTTFDLSYILTGLQPETKCEVQVCASTSKGKGPKANLSTISSNMGETMPEKPTFGLIGRKELTVRWQPPQVITGKLTRYELMMNGKCVYSGLADNCQVNLLKPDTEYSFVIVAITSEGKCKSKASKVKTLKDEINNEARYNNSSLSSSEPTKKILNREKSPTRSPDRKTNERPSLYNGRSETKDTKKPLTNMSNRSPSHSPDRSPDRRTTENRAPLYPGLSDKEPNRRNTLPSTDRSPDRSPERRKTVNQITDKPIMLQRHKSTLTQKTRNFNRRRDNNNAESIAEETVEYDQVINSTSVVRKDQLQTQSSISSANSLSKSITQFEHNSLSSFLPPVGKASSQQALTSGGDNCKSSSLYFEDPNPSSNLQVFKSLNREKEIIKEASNRMKEANNYNTTKYISQTSNNNNRSKAILNRGSSMSNLSNNNPTVEVSGSLAGSKNVAFSTITLNLKELTPSFPSITNGNHNNDNSFRARSGSFYNSTNKVSQSFSNGNYTSSSRSYDRSPTRNDRSSNAGQYDSGVSESKEAPLMSILKNLHKDKISKNPGADYQPHTFAHMPISEMKMSFLSNFPKQT